MSEEQVTNNKKNEGIGPIEAYHILLQRQISEDRLLGERTSMFFLATSFLFLAFITLLNLNLAGPIFKVLRIILPVLGIILTFWLRRLNLSATNALHFWHRGQQKIEETAPEFTFMRDSEITPHLHGYQAIRGEKRWDRTNEGKWVFKPIKSKPRSWFHAPLRWGWLHPIYQRYLPAIFLVLWVASLIVAIIH